ncbi:MAG: fatty acid desaturase [Bacteroidota bacterium]
MSSIINSPQVREIINKVVRDPAYQEVSRVPLFSFHQITLIGLSYLLVFGGVYCHLALGWSLWIVYPFMIFGFYTAFTPLHDATHRSLSSNKALNDVLGTISAMLLFPFANTPGYRYIHLSHHRFVGDKDLDPDEPMVHVPTKYFPLGYLLLFFSDFLWVYWIIFKAWKKTPVAIRTNIIGMAIGNIVFNVLWLISPFWLEYLVIFLIPNRLGITYIAWAFAHLPHPEGVSWNQQPMEATFWLKGNKRYLATLWGQAHHAMHHFLPHIPWYKYHKVWDLANGVFHRENIPSKHVLDKPDINYKSRLAQKKHATTEEYLSLIVAEVEEVAKGIKTFRFVSPDNTALPAFEAGAHIQIKLPSGKIRSYSLVNAPHEKNFYQIAVKREDKFGSGSVELHDQVEPGTLLEVKPPKNNFTLYENANRYVLIAGGIGITPMISMAHRLTELEKPFEFHVCSKRVDEIPFQYELKNWSFAPCVEFHLDKNKRSTLPINTALADAKADSLIYMCGPSGFMEFVHTEALLRGWKKNQIIQESFSAPSSKNQDNKAFDIQLTKSNKSLSVAADETIIDALLKNNVKIEYSCLQGTCGSCITNISHGSIDHRDAVLSEQEKCDGKLICPCVSRAVGDKLELQL